ncbi:MAG: hypothetical protein ACI4KR_12440 [Ruminiclostridium sp.]
MGKSTFEEEIRRKGKLIYTNVGDSMAPLIRQGRDLLIISAVNGRLKKYDIPLYKRDSGQSAYLTDTVPIRQYNWVSPEILRYDCKRKTAYGGGKL